MKVLKFGGSSINCPEDIRRVRQIIESQTGQVIIVASAFHGITDLLLELSKHAAQRNRSFFRLFNEIEKRHIETVKGLFDEPLRENVLETINAYLKDLINIINGVYLLNDLTPKVQDRILGFGEVLSSCILSYVIPNSEVVDVKSMIKTDSHFGNARINFPLTNRLIRSAFKNFTKTGIVPGFIGSNERSDTTTLGRGGSDYTAAVISAALDVERLEIWTDVDGFMTADPKKVKKALPIEYLSYAEAMELWGWQKSC